MVNAFAASVRMQVNASVQEDMTLMLEVSCDV